MADSAGDKYAPYVGYARERSARIRAEGRARYEEALVAAREVAAFLRSEYRPSRIILFGSLLHPEIFHLDSDIDIAIEGIAWPAYLHAWNQAESRARGFRLDLVDLASASKGLRVHVLQDGVPL